MTTATFPIHEGSYDMSAIDRNATKLIFNANFNQYIHKHELPPSLKSLVLSDNFNCGIELGALPEGLEEINFGRRYSQHITKGLLPSTLKRLTLFGQFDGEIEQGSLPEGLEEIDFGPTYGKKIAKGLLPSTLKKLAMTSDCVDEGSIPENVEEVIIIMATCTLLDLSLFPKGLKILRIMISLPDNFHDRNLPEGLEELELGMVSMDQPLAPGFLPSTLKKLILPYEYNEQIGPGLLPEGLESIQLTEWYKGTVEHIPLTTRIYSVNKQIKDRNYTYVRENKGKDKIASKRRSKRYLIGEGYSYQTFDVSGTAYDVTFLPKKKGNRS